MKQKRFVRVDSWDAFEDANTDGLRFDSLLDLLEALRTTADMDRKTEAALDLLIDVLGDDDAVFERAEDEDTEA